jgi:hypothetical protein
MRNCVPVRRVRRALGLVLHRGIPRLEKWPNERTPGRRFTDVETSCGSASEACALWEHDDAKELVADARVAGGLDNEGAMYKDDEEGLLSCSTSSRPVVFTIELIGSVPLGGPMTMS